MQSFVVFTVNLCAVQLVGKHYNSVLIGTAQAVAVGVVGELKIYAVGVAIKADFRVGVESGVVGNDDVINRFVMSIKRFNVRNTDGKLTVVTDRHFVEGFILWLELVYICRCRLCDINFYAICIQR